MITDVKKPLNTDPVTNTGNPNEQYEGYEKVVSLEGVLFNSLALAASTVTFALYLCLSVCYLKLTSPWYVIVLRSFGMSMCLLYFFISLVWQNFLTPVGNKYKFIPLFVAYTLELVIVSFEYYNDTVSFFLFAADFLVQVILNFGLCFIGTRNDFEDSYLCTYKMYHYKKTSLIPLEMTTAEVKKYRPMRIQLTDSYGTDYFVYQKGYFRKYLGEELLSRP